MVGVSQQFEPSSNNKIVGPTCRSGLEALGVLSRSALGMLPIASQG